MIVLVIALAVVVLVLLASLFALALCWAAGRADELDDEIERYLGGRP